MDWSERDLPRLDACLIAAGLAALAVAPAVAAAPAVDLLSHRAAYRLSLAQADAGSGLSRVRGGLVLEWRAACDGWLSQQRLGFVAEMDDGPGFTYDVRFSSWESIDNTQLRFTVRSFDGPTMQEEFRGRAKLAAPGNAGTAHYQLPEPEDVALPAGTIFPTAHVADIIAAARAGERIISRQVFDGSGEDALTRATAVIGAARTSALVAGGEAEPSWPVSIAYFAADSEDVLPQFEIAFDLSAGGVLSNVRLDYGDFTLRAELEKLETLARPDCR
jgi:EipB-like